jgi:multidrug resistance protein, MATE family
MQQITCPCRDLHWEQKPTKQLVDVGWPLAVSMLSYAVMTLADTFFVGKLGSSELSAVGLGGTASWAVLCFSFGLFRGTKVLVSQAVGAENTAKINRVLGASLALGAVLSLLTWLVAWGVAQSLPWLTPNIRTGDMCQSYFSIRLVATPILFIFAPMRECCYGQSDSKSPMLASLLANLVNILGDYLLIWVLNMGVDGAAIATAIAHCVELLVLVWVQKKVRFGLHDFRIEDLKELWRMGFPTGLQFLLEMGAFAIMTAMLSRLGDVSMGAHVIALQVIHFSFLPAVAIGEAASILVGQAIGANRWYWVHRLAHTSLWISLAYNCLCSFTLWLGARPIAAVFSNDPAVITQTTHLLWVAGVFLLFDSVNIVARSVLRGTGDVLIPAYLAIISAWLCTPPLTWLLAYHFKLGALGGWLALSAEIVLASALLWHRLWANYWIGPAKKASGITSPCTTKTLAK